jgi:hypothetical protein
VVVACHSFLVALPARSVVRLALPDEVTDAVWNAGDTPFLGTVRAAGRICAAWDLGQMLEMAPLTSAWAVLDVDYGGASVSIALRTGVCALVIEVRPEASLPGRIFRSRSRAFPAAFATASVDQAQPALFGLWTDPVHLFTRDELAQSSHAIAGAREKGNGT